jgi:S-adenosylmethionine-dependent methyltransferase
MTSFPASETNIDAFAPATSALDQEAEFFALAPPFRHDQGSAWMVELPPALQGEAPGSRLPPALYEDDRRLGPTNAMHAHIRSGGSGAHAFWLKYLCFSTSDASDPNTNGRRYTMRREVDLMKNHRTISPDAAATFREFVIATLFDETVKMAGDITLPRAQWIETPEGQKALTDTLFARLDDDRKTIVPWLNEARSLVGVRILEIGCGTGSSTLALAEQGAHVVGVDIHAGTLRIAEQRCRHYGVTSVEFCQANAADLPAEIRKKQFDFVVFFASLEHMTYDERLSALSDCWSILPSAGFICCTDTPNRLWYVDGHTSHLPFFNWLPDQLAIRYAKFSSVPSLRRALGNFEPTPEKEERLLRAGRGLSFHEFELAIGRVHELKVISCLDKARFHRIKYGHKIESDEFIYSLMALAPEMHAAWFFPRIDIIIQKS